MIAKKTICDQSKIFTHLELTISYYLHCEKLWNVTKYWTWTLNLGDFINKNNSDYSNNDTKND